MTEFRHEITAALAPMARRLDGIERRQIAQGELIARLDERTVTPPARRSGGRLNGHAKTMGGAGMMAVVWALVEIIQTLIAAP